MLISHSCSSSASWLFVDRFPFSVGQPPLQLYKAYQRQSSSDPFDRLFCSIFWRLSDLAPWFIHQRQQQHSTTYSLHINILKWKQKEPGLCFISYFVLFGDDNRSRLRTYCQNELRWWCHQVRCYSNFRTTVYVLPSSGVCTPESSLTSLNYQVAKSERGGLGIEKGPKCNVSVFVWVLFIIMFQYRY